MYIYHGQPPPHCWSIKSSNSLCPGACTGNTIENILVPTPGWMQYHAWRYIYLSIYIYIYIRIRSRHSILVSNNVGPGSANVRVYAHSIQTVAELTPTIQEIETFITPGQTLRGIYIYICTKIEGILARTQTWSSSSSLSQGSSFNRQTRWQSYQYIYIYI